MASRPIVVVDTDVLILMAENPAFLSKAEQDRQAYAELHVESWAKRRAMFVIPSPVLAELAAGGRDALELVEALLPGARVEDLSAQSAVIAGGMIAKVLRDPARGNRTKMKFDALIAGTAEAIGAEAILSGNSDDLVRCIVAGRSTAKVIDIGDPPPGQTLRMFAAMPEDEPVEADEP